MHNVKYILLRTIWQWERSEQPDPSASLLSPDVTILQVPRTHDLVSSEMKLIALFLAHL